MLAAYVLASLLWAANAEAEAFSTGEAIGRYSVVEVVEHPEFQRITFAGPEGTSHVEVTFADEWQPGRSTEYYRIQPAPGGTALPDDLVEALREVLLEMESERGHVPFVRKAERGTPGSADDGSHSNVLDQGFSALSSLAWPDVVSFTQWSYPFLCVAFLLRVIGGFGWRRRQSKAANT